MEIKANILEDLFIKQQALIKHYQEIEGLPPYPIDISSKGGQKLLKDFGRRFLEELSEAFVELNIAKEFIENNHKKRAEQHLIAYNLEIADSMHFLLEFLIYAGIEKTEDLENMLLSYITESEENAGLFTQGAPFHTLLKIGAAANYKEGLSTTRIPSSSAYSICSNIDALGDLRKMGGRNISKDILDSHSKLLWESTVLLNQCLNLMKNREWRTQENLVVNTTQFQNSLTLFLISFAAYLDYAGHTEPSLVVCYNVENEKNLNRIKYGY